MSTGPDNDTILTDSPPPNNSGLPNSTAAQAIERLQAAHADWITKVVIDRGEVTAFVPAAFIAEACAALKSDPDAKFDFLADLCGVDQGVEEEPRFEVNYHLFSTTLHHRLRLKVLLDETNVHVPTVTGVWRTANWHERETFDLFGIVFDGHPDLRRILLPDDWQGYALRKDFPLRGYEPYSLK